jgi:hypothetical protein
MRCVRVSRGDDAANQVCGLLALRQTESTHNQWILLTPPMQFKVFAILEALSPGSMSMHSAFVPTSFGK